MKYLLILLCSCTVQTAEPEPKPLPDMPYRPVISPVEIGATVIQVRAGDFVLMQEYMLKSESWMLQAKERLVTCE